MQNKHKWRTVSSTSTERLIPIKARLETSYVRANKKIRLIVSRCRLRAKAGRSALLLAMNHYLCRMYYPIMFEKKEGGRHAVAEKCVLSPECVGAISYKAMLLCGCHLDDKWSFCGQCSTARVAEHEVLYYSNGTDFIHSRCLSIQKKSWFVSIDVAPSLLNSRRQLTTEEAEALSSCLLSTTLCVKGTLWNLIFSTSFQGSIHLRLHNNAFSAS